MTTALYVVGVVLILAGVVSIAWADVFSRIGWPGLLVPGPLAGAPIAESVREPDWRRAAKIGVGTLIGFVLGTAVKYAPAVILPGLALALDLP